MRLVKILFATLVALSLHGQVKAQNCPNGQCSYYYPQQLSYRQVTQSPTYYYTYPNYQYRQLTYQSVSYVQPISYSQYSSQVSPIEYTQNASANSFLSWLNSIRSQYGLPQVSYDTNMENWANQNNIQQSYRGMGHHVMGSARRQNSAMGPYQTILTMWMQSPGHRSALLDPTIRFVGIASLGAYWTFNAY